MRSTEIESPKDRELAAATALLQRELCFIICLGQINKIQKQRTRRRRHCICILEYGTYAPVTVVVNVPCALTSALMPSILYR